MADGQDGPPPLLLFDRLKNEIIPVYSGEAAALYIKRTKDRKYAEKGLFRTGEFCDFREFHANPRPLVVDSSNDVNKAGVLMQETNVNSLALISMFVQTGVFSGHSYHPSANHRPLIFNTFHYGTTKKDGTVIPPLIKSLVMPSPSYNFSAKDTMSVFPYEVVEGDSMEHCLALKSQSPMTISSFGNFQGYGVIENCHAATISNAAFREAVAFFGLLWMRKKEDGTPYVVEEDAEVTLNDVRCLISTIGTHNVDTIVAFKSFLNSFHMEKLFRYQDELPLETNIRHFFALYAKSTRFRIVYFDGKHRGLVSGYFATGIYEPHPTIDFSLSPFKTYEECLSFAGVRKEEVIKSEFQCFTRQSISIGTPAKKADLQEQLSVLESFGCDRTISQNISVADTLKTHWGEFMSWLEENDKLDNIHPLNYNNMWNHAKSLVELNSNLNTIHDHLMEWVVSRNKIQLVNGNCDFQQTQKYLGDKMVALSWIADVTALQKCKSVGPDLQAIATLSKYVLMDNKATSALNSFISGDSKVIQAPIPRDEIDYFYTYNFYNKHLMKNLCCACNIIQNKIMMEKHYIIMLRTAPKIIQLTNDIKENWPRFPLYENFFGSDYVKKTGKGAYAVDSADTFFKTIADSHFSQYNHTKPWCNLGKKLLFCTHHDIICDFFEVSAHYGLNPVFKHKVHDTPANSKLALYMNGGIGYETADKIIRIGKKAPGAKVLIEILLELYCHYLMSICPTSKNFGFDILDPHLAGDKDTLNKGRKKRSNQNPHKHGFVLTDRKESIVLWNGAGEISARDIIPAKYKFSHFMHGVMNNSIDTDDKEYHKLWKSLGYPRVMQEYKEAHKSMLVAKLTEVPLPRNKKKKKDGAGSAKAGSKKSTKDAGSDDGEDGEEDESEEKSTEGSNEGSGGEPKKKKPKTTKKPQSVQEVYELNERQLKPFRDKGAFIKEAKTMHLDPDIHPADFGLAMQFLKNQGLFTAGSLLPIDGKSLGERYNDNNLANSGQLLNIRDDITKECAAKTTKKITDQQKGALEVLNRAISTNQAWTANRNEEYMKSLKQRSLETATVGVAYDREGNLAPPSIISKTLQAEIDDTRTPQQKSKDQQERLMVLAANNLLPANVSIPSTNTSPSNDTSETLKDSNVTTPDTSSEALEADKNKEDEDDVDNGKEKEDAVAAPPTEENNQDPAAEPPEPAGNKTSSPKSPKSPRVTSSGRPIIAPKKYGTEEDTTEDRNSKRKRASTEDEDEDEEESEPESEPEE